MPAKSDPRASRVDDDVDERAGSKFFYRRRVSGRDLLPAIGLGLAAGILAFYVAQIYLQRTPLVPARKGGSDAGPKRRSLPKPGG
jgi:hypothetical protein